jgi:hypothetical protein
MRKTKSNDGGNNCVTHKAGNNKRSGVVEIPGKDTCPIGTLLMYQLNTEPVGGIKSGFHARKKSIDQQTGNQKNNISYQHSLNLIILVQLWFSALYCQY